MKQGPLGTSLISPNKRPTTKDDHDDEEDCGKEKGRDRSNILRFMKQAPLEKEGRDRSNIFRFMKQGPPGSFADITEQTADDEGRPRRRGGLRERGKGRDRSNVLCLIRI
jgi:hypothetical protein